MKRFLSTFACVFLVLILGCDNSKLNEKGFPVGSPADEDGDFAVRMNGSPWFFRYVEIDGHEYLMMHGMHRSGITHSPNCKCLREHSENFNKRPSVRKRRQNGNHNCK